MVGKKYEDAQQRESEQEVAALERKLHQDWTKRQLRRPNKANDGHHQTEDD